MDKRIKKLSSVVLCAAMLAVSAPVGVFADTNRSGVKVVSKYEEKDRFIKGTIDLQNGLQNTVISDEDGTYMATFGGEVDVREVFEGAYKTYLTKYKDKPSFIEGLTGKKYENIVMFDEGEKYPTCTFRVQLPKGAQVDINTIEVKENTDMLGEYEIIPEGNDTYAIKFKLGGWYDYKGYFAVYEKERLENGHNVSIQIPYTVSVPAEESSIGIIKTDGYCRLFKYGKFMSGKQIVDVEALENIYTITR